MSRELSTTARSAVYAQSTNEAFIGLITIDHPTFTEPLRVADDPYELLPLANVRGVVSRGNEYLFLPFQYELPQQDDSGISRAKITVDNVDRRIVQAVRSANSALSVTMEIVLSSDPDTLEISIDGFQLKRAKYDALVVTGDLSIEYFDLEPCPAGRFTPNYFPGLF